MQHAPQGLLTSDLGDQLDLGGRKVDVAGQQVEAVDPSAHQHIVDGHTRFDQKVMDGQFQVVMLDAQSSRQRALGIEIHQEHSATVFGQRRTQVDGRRRLADAALLVAHRDDHRGSVVRQRCRLGYLADRSTCRAEFFRGNGEGFRRWRGYWRRIYFEHRLWFGGYSWC